MKRIQLQIENAEYSLEGILEALAEFDLNEDFNGNNGEEYLWECAKGYESNKAYTLDLLRNRYKDNWRNFDAMIEMCDDYFSHVFDYKDEYNFDVDRGNGYATITLAYKFGEY